jgi:hypothetical protein
VLPWPFSRIAIAVGAPVMVERQAQLSDAKVSDRLRHHMEESLHAQYRAARQALR